MNLRIGKWQISEEREIIEKHNSNSTINNEENKLIEFCVEIGGIIKNGDTKGHW